MGKGEGGIGELEVEGSNAVAGLGGDSSLAENMEVGVQRVLGVMEAFLDPSSAAQT